MDGSMPAKLKTLLIDAQNISELTFGSQLVYNLLVARCTGQNSDAMSQKRAEHELLNDWAETILSRPDELVKWAKYPQKCLWIWGDSTRERWFFNIVNERMSM